MSNKSKDFKVKVGKIVFSNNEKMKLIAGPCQIESRDHAMETCSEINEICKKLDLEFIYKSSFDKANRTSIRGARGIGLEKGIKILSEIKEKYNCPVITDVHESYQCEIVSKCVDIIQIPAYLCRQTDLLVSAGKTNCVVNVKKGQFLSPWEMTNVIEKILSTGNNKILITERGTMFGYNNLVTDLRSLPLLKKNGFPVVFDATHSVQIPGGKGNSSDGQREFVEFLARAAAAVGVAGIFMETHQDPDNAPSDGPNMVPLNKLENLLIKLIKIDKLIKNN